MSNVLATPWWPIKPPSQASLINNSCMELLSTHNLFSFHFFYFQVKITFIFKFLRFNKYVSRRKYLKYHCVFTSSGKDWKILICCFYFWTCFWKYFKRKCFLNFKQIYFHSCHLVLRFIFCFHFHFLKIFFIF